MNAYDRIYLEKARNALGNMLEYAVHDLEHSIGEFWGLFLKSDVSRRFERGDASVIAGKSGIELALTVCGMEKNYPRPSFAEEKSEEYWTGWVLAYYQWNMCVSFSQIDEVVSIEEIRGLYSPYHEMDVRQFCDRLNQICAERLPETNLKRKRLAAGLSQSQLATVTGIPVRTIQQYEQGRKDVNKARAEYVIALSRALYCAPEQLLEPFEPYRC